MQICEPCMSVLGSTVAFLRLPYLVVIRSTIFIGSPLCPPACLPLLRVFSVPGIIFGTEKSSSIV